MTLDFKKVGIVLAAAAIYFYKKNSDTIKKLQNALTSEINAREAEDDILHEKTGDHDYDLQFTPILTLDYATAGKFFSQLVIEIYNNNSQYSYRLGDFICAGIHVMGKGINTFKPYNDNTYTIGPKQTLRLVVWQRTQMIYGIRDFFKNENIPVSDYIFAKGSTAEAEVIKAIKSSLDEIGSGAWNQLDDPDREPVVLGNFSIDQMKFKVYNTTGAALPLEKPIINITGIFQVVHGEDKWYQKFPTKEIPMEFGGDSVFIPISTIPMKGGIMSKYTVKYVPFVTEYNKYEIWFGRNVFDDKSKEYFGNE